MAGDALLDEAERIANGDLGAIEQLTAQEVADFFDLVFGLVADYRGEHWGLEPRSAQRLGRWVKRCIEKHGWSWVVSWAPEIMAALVLFFEVGRRVRIDVELAKAAKAKAAAQAEVAE